MRQLDEKPSLRRLPLAMAFAIVAGFSTSALGGWNALPELARGGQPRDTPAWVHDGNR